MEFPNWFNSEWEKIRLVDSMINDGLGALTGVLREYASLVKIKSQLTKTPFPKQADTLKGCDALAHSLHLQDVLDMPVADVTLTAFNCGCVMGMLGMNEVTGSMCEEHTGRLTGERDTNNYSNNTIIEAQRVVQEKWLRIYRDHWLEKHDWMDRDKFDQVQEQLEHDDIARKLLDD